MDKDHTVNEKALDENSNSESIFSCEKCGKTFENRIKLKKHSSIDHYSHYRYQDKDEK